VPAAAVIPAPIVYGRVAAVKKLVVGLKEERLQTRRPFVVVVVLLLLIVEVDGGLLNGSVVSCFLGNSLYRPSSCYFEQLKVLKAGILRGVKGPVARMKSHRITKQD
jgi:hypothetical protein